VQPVEDALVLSCMGTVYRFYPHSTMGYNIASCTR